MGQLVAQHTLELLAIELLEQSSRDRDRRMLWIAPRRKGIRGGVVYDVDLEHWHVRRDGHLANDVDELGGRLFIDLLGAGDGEDQLVASEVRSEGEHDSEADGKQRDPYA